jgi:hypothetical protein
MVAAPAWGASRCFACKRGRCSAPTARRRACGTRRPKQPCRRSRRSPRQRLATASWPRRSPRRGTRATRSSLQRWRRRSRCTAAPRAHLRAPRRRPRRRPSLRASGAGTCATGRRGGRLVSAGSESTASAESCCREAAWCLSQTVHPRRAAPRRAPATCSPLRTRRRPLRSASRRRRRSRRMSSVLASRQSPSTTSRATGACCPVRTRVVARRRRPRTPPPSAAPRP